MTAVFIVPRSTTIITIDYPKAIPMNDPKSNQRKPDTTERQLYDVDHLDPAGADAAGDMLPGLSRLTDHEFSQFLDRSLQPDPRGRMLH